MIEIKAPNNYDDHKGKKSIFLAGSIEMGKAGRWQGIVVEALKDIDDLLILNPRRNGWNSSWDQSIDNPQFKEQVEWELDGIHHVDYIAMYYDPKTKSPITMMEFGLYAKSNPEKLIVCCPEGFWRKGNVDVVCSKYGVEQVDSLEALIENITNKIK